MNLFGKEKDLIQKITNLVLLMWLIGSIVILYINIIDIVMPRPVMSYKEYENANCMYTDYNTEDKCQEQYNNYKKYNDTDIYNKKKIIFTSIGSVIIVSSALYFINRKGKE